MAALIDALTKTISLLLEVAVSGADAAFEKAKPTARIYLRSIIITTLSGLLLIPFFIILKAATGLAIFGYSAALLAMILAVVFGLLYAPLGMLIGMLAGKTVNPAEAGERYLKFIGPLVFAVLMASLYLARVPWERNAEALVVLAIAAAAAALGSLMWGSWISGRTYTFVAIVIASLTTMSFLFPKAFEGMEQKLKELDTNIAKLLGYHEPDPNIIYSSSGRARQTVRQPSTASTTKQMAADAVQDSVKAAQDSVTALVRAQLGLDDKRLQQAVKRLKEKRMRELAAR